MGGFYFGSGYFGGVFAPDAPINAVLDVQETEQIYPYEGIEPVTVDEVKEYARIDYDVEDNLIQSFITVARIMLEQYTGLSFVQKRLIVNVNNGCGGIELPYGPIPGGVAAIDLTLVTDGYGNAINPGNIVLSGLEFINVQAPCAPLLQFIYSAGYASLPEVLKNAIKAQAFYLYENRGELQGTINEGGGRGFSPNFICQAAKVMCIKYRRVSNLTM
jgi:uncharacterized phiE125 gp8 family phage protein